MLWVVKIPNYVYIALSVNGCEQELRKFDKFMTTKAIVKNGVKVGKDNRLDHNKLIPYPEKYKLLDKAHNNIDLTKEEKKKLLLIKMEHNTNKDGFNSGGYEWCSNNWNTKWGFCDVDMTTEDFNGGELLYHFSTAWSMPTPLLNKMAEMFPKLEFNYEYEEESFAFLGDGKYSNGKLEYDDYREPTEEEIKERDEEIE